jgi:membrane fusion protein, heavy metal efflux system
MILRPIFRTTVAVCACAALLAGGCKGRKLEEPTKNEAKPAEGGTALQPIHLTPEAIQTISLQTEPARAQELASQLVTTAVIKPNEYRIAHVSPRVPGKAVEVYAKLGDNVKKSTVLAELDSLELGAKKAALLRAEADLNVTRRSYNREKGLYAKQISSERDYLAAKGDFERSEAAYNEAREALRLLDLPDSDIARITWSGAGGRLSWFPLLSPFSGTVIERHITVGEQIRPDETVLTIADLDVVWLLADVYERDLGRVAVGDPVQVSVDSYPGEVFRGHIAYISNTVDHATRTASARVEIDNPDHRLRFGMFATARIALRPAPNERVAGVMVPIDAVQRVGTKSVVFVEQKPGTYLPRQVALGNTSSNDAEIVSGLSAGERVVTKGSFYLKSILLRESIGGED